MFLINMNLPPFGRYCFFHKVSFLWNSSSIGSYALPNLWGATKRRPKYSVGRFPTFQPNTKAKPPTFVPSSIWLNSPFTMFIFKLDIASNHMKVNLDAPNALDHCHKEQGYCRQTKIWYFHPPPLPLPLLLPTSSSHFESWDVAPFSSSPHNLTKSLHLPIWKGKRERVSLPLKPIEFSKKPNKIPFTRTENFIVEMHHLIHLTHLWPNPILSKIDNKKSLVYMVVCLFNLYFAKRLLVARQNS